MSELKATPGKWKAVDVFVESDNGDAVVTAIGKAGHDEEARANAHLIAAARELYAALKGMLEAYDDGCQPDWAQPYLTTAYKALAKARGEKS